MRQSISTISVAIVAALTAGHWSVANADLTFKIVTAPTTTAQLQTEATVTRHAGDCPTVGPIAHARAYDLSCDGPSQRVKLTLGSSAVYKLREGEVKYVVNNNDSTVVSVESLSTNGIFKLVPKSLGRASVLLFDSSDKVIDVLKIEVGAIQIGSQPYDCWSAGCVMLGETKNEKPTGVQVIK